MGAPSAPFAQFASRPPHKHRDRGRGAPGRPRPCLLLAGAPAPCPLRRAVPRTVRLERHNVAPGLWCCFYRMARPVPSLASREPLLGPLTSQGCRATRAIPLLLRGALSPSPRAYVPSLVQSLAQDPLLPAVVLPPARQCCQPAGDGPPLTPPLAPLLALWLAPSLTPSLTPSWTPS